MAAALTAEDFTALRLQYQNERTEGEYPAAIESIFSQGVMMTHYWIKPSPAFLAREEVAAAAMDDIVFLQKPDQAPWEVHLHDKTMTQDTILVMPDNEFHALLQKCGISLYS